MKTSLAAEFWIFWSLSRCFGEPDRRKLQQSSFDKTKAQRRGSVASLVMDVTNSLNFYVGRSADVGDMLFHGQFVSECYAQMFCLQGKQNISVSYVNGGQVRVWERGSVRDNEQTLCFIIIHLKLV